MTSAGASGRDEERGRRERAGRARARRPRERAAGSVRAGRVGPGRRRSVCPVACTLEVIGDRWTLLVVRDMLRGLRRFGEFLRSPEGISTNILADRLRALEAAGLVRSTPCASRRRAAEYELTDAGRMLAPVLAAVRDWGLRYVPGTEAKLNPS